MAGNSIPSIIGKSVLLLLLIVALVIGGIIWFDFLGVIDRGNTLDFITTRLGIAKSEPIKDETENIYLLDAVRIIKEREAIEQMEVVLKSREEAITLEEAKNKQIQEELKEKENSIIDKEKSLNEALSRYNDEQKNLETTVKYLGELPPQSVVAILNNYPILKIVDTLRKEDELAQQNNRVSNSATWILFMEPKMAAEVQDMMIKKPTIKS